MSKRKIKKTYLPAKKRKEYVEQITQEEQEDVPEEAVKLLIEELHCKYFPERKEFVDLCSKEPTLNALIKAGVRKMQELYKKLLAKYCKGKHFIQMQQAWFLHISVYCGEDNVEGNHEVDKDDQRKLKESWSTIVKEANKYNCIVSIDDQRIIVATLAYIVYDLMSNKVKEKKVDSEETTEYHNPLVHETAACLYRFAGAALSAMINKRKKISLEHPQLKLLHEIKLKENEWDILPDQVQSLNDGGLVTVSPCMLPYVEKIMELVNKHVNADKLKLHGKNMIQLASDNIFKIEINQLQVLFKNCVKKLGVADDNMDDIFLEMSTKIFNARVNEFMSSMAEIDLEKQGKITSADQSLRDILKTYSIQKARYL